MGTEAYGHVVDGRTRRQVADDGANTFGHGDRSGNTRDEDEWEKMCCGQEVQPQESTGPTISLSGLTPFVPPLGMDDGNGRRHCGVEPRHKTGLLNVAQLLSRPRIIGDLSANGTALVKWLGHVWHRLETKNTELPIIKLTS